MDKKLFVESLATKTTTTTPTTPANQPDKCIEHKSLLLPDPGDRCNSSGNNNNNDHIIHHHHHHHYHNSLLRSPSGCSSNRNNETNSDEYNNSTLLLEYNNNPNMDEEKCDISPENSKKSSVTTPDEITVSTATATFTPTATATVVHTQSLHPVKDLVLDDIPLFNNEHHVTKTSNNSLKSRQQPEPCDNRLKIEENDDDKNAVGKQAFTFTIDFGSVGGSNADSSQRHKSMMERFQQRHKRGVSLSKLDDRPSSSISTPPLPLLSSGGAVSKQRPPMSARLPRRKTDTTSNHHHDDEQQQHQQPIVRLRDKSAPGLGRGSESKRHSWSPRSSVMESSASSASIGRPSVATDIRNGCRYVPRSTALTLALSGTPSSDYHSLESSNFELACPEPPLEFVKDEEAVSEAGTYTLDGDNYTEEQKEKMNIDKQHLKMIREQQQLKIIDLESNLSPQRKNILEISCCHDSSTSLKPKISYLDKIKSRVRNIGEKTFGKDGKNKESSMSGSSPDQGIFTSVTTSGILAKKPTLDNHPQFRRRNSLTKSQIDSSEYVQGISRLNIRSDEKQQNSFTDSEKVSAATAAEYQLNIFSKTKSIVNDMNTDNPAMVKNEKNSSLLALKTASTKSDWIQEWARNARKSTEQMSRSYNFEEPGLNYHHGHQPVDMTKSDYYDPNYEEFGDNLDRNYHRKPNDRFRTINANESSSDPNLRARPTLVMAHQNSPTVSRRDQAGVKNVKSGVQALNLYASEQQLKSPPSYSSATRPPMSPSRIPSPIHSMARGRQIGGMVTPNRMRSHHGSTTDLSAPLDTDFYLQKTAAAISTLQNLHRKNSLQNSPQNSNSPVHKLSPIHTLRLTSSNQPGVPEMGNFKEPLSPQSARNRQMHKRNLSLDGTSNSNSDGLNGITDLRRHSRHHSYEGELMLPPKPVKAFAHFDQTNSHYEGCGRSSTRGDERPASKMQNSKAQKTKLAAQNSPICRSSSFSVKPLTGTNGSGYSKASAIHQKQSAIQKSASSTSFKKLIGFDDENAAFYINDDDDLNAAAAGGYSSDSDLSDHVSDIKDSIRNTRYNKTFLMRIEQSRRPTSGTTQTAAKQGVAACPNTPEMPRRDVAARTSFRERASMPRDSSLTRMRQDVTSLSNAKRTLTATTPSRELGSAGKRVQPKYLDISKYKPAQGNNFLKKDETKSYLKEPVKRSPSSASVNLTRSDPARASNRSVKSAGTTKINAKKEAAAKLAKEAELAMWRRRASYDPMKAAAEGRKKQEEAKKQAQIQQSKFNDSSIVLRSQSFHSGVSGTGDDNESEFGANMQQDSGNRNSWAITSNETSDDEYGGHA